MAHHKRGRSKAARAGCKMCKSHKQPGTKDTNGARTHQQVLADYRFDDFMSELVEKDDEEDDEAV